VWARLRGPVGQVNYVRESLTLDTPGVEYMRWKVGDGKTRFLRRGDVFLSGLTWRVAQILVGGGYPMPTVKWPLVMERKPWTPTPLDTRGYQEPAVVKMVRARRMGVQSPTGSGKTMIGVEAARRIGHRTLWLTHRKELLAQTADVFRDSLGIVPGIVGAGKDFEGDGRLVIASVQTLARMLDKKRGAPDTVKPWLADFGCVIGDEGHHASAPTWQDIFEACTNANYRFVLSATLDTGNEVSNWKIEGATGPTYIVAETADLARQGFLAMPHVIVLRVPTDTYPSYEEIRDVVCPGWQANPRALRSLGARLFTETYERGIMNNGARNSMVVLTAVQHATRQEKVLVLCSRVPHAAALMDDARRLNPCPVYVLDGGCNDLTRQATLNLFKRGAGAILFATPFFREGVDIPQIDVGVLAGGGLSDVAVTQGLGRVLRPRPDKAEVLWYDFMDGGALTDRPEKDYLRVHSESRLALYTTSGFKVETR